MSELIKLELDGLPPTVNHLYRNYRGRRYKTTSGRKYQEHIAEQIRREWKGKPAYKEPVELRIIFTTNDRRKWDIDNRVKALQDCLSLAGMIEDDRQINILYAERRQGDKTATQIEVRAIDTA
ncbi:MAG: RusA family crossover junction endodeoxyribonuclease [Synergistaceae bacterium]|nr:RusA family crossover junction endodeoxyribonuclease [Synergistaceae bacterium]